MVVYSVPYYLYLLNLISIIKRCHFTITLWMNLLKKSLSIKMI